MCNLYNNRAVRAANRKVEVQEIQKFRWVYNNRGAVGCLRYRIWSEVNHLDIWLENCIPANSNLTTRPSLTMKIGSVYNIGGEDRLIDERGKQNDLHPDVRE